MKLIEIYLAGQDTFETTIDGDTIIVHWGAHKNSTSSNPVVIISEEFATEGKVREGNTTKASSGGGGFYSPHATMDLAPEK